MRIPRSKLKQKPIKYLRRLCDYLNNLIAEIESGPRREIDIATEHPEHPEQLWQTLRIDGNPQKDKSWLQVERVFCEPRCPNCPHGDFFYRYYRRKDGSLRKEYKGTALFSHEDLERGKKDIRPPIAELTIDQLKERRKA